MTSLSLLATTGEEARSNSAIFGKRLRYEKALAGGNPINKQ